MHHAAFEDGPASCSRPTRNDWVFLPQLLETNHVVVSGYRAAIASIITEDQSMGCAAKPGGGLNKGVEHGLKIEGRVANHLEHVGGGGLLLQRLPQLIKEPRVLDGDDGLLSEILDQFYLLVAKRAYLLAKDVNRADQLVILEHWNGEHASIAGEFGCVEGEWMPLEVGLRRLDVGDVCRLLGGSDAPEGHVGRWPDERLAFKHLDVGGRGIMRRNGAETIRLAQEKCPKLGAADTHRVLEHALKNGSQFPGRTADDPQNLGCRRLLLQGLGEFARALLLGFE